ncbi:MAG: polysaccharide biosynthesis/export family protein [Opitutaceae bacterium]|nr:polysaccharide biosynthesis/export family protein [Opitutaceae bacterium]
MTNGRLPPFYLTMISRKLILMLALLVATGGLWAANGDASSSGKVKEDYVIQASDLIRVQVFQEDDLTRDVRVTQGNTVNLPLIGVVEVKDLTIRQAADKIRSMYYDGEFLVNPQVNVSVIEYAIRTVSVLGAVNTPGAIPFPLEEGMTLVEAITKAGGHNRYADLRKVQLSRRETDGRTVSHVINVRELMDGTSKETWPLRRDDVVFVPERIL